MNCFRSVMFRKFQLIRDMQILTSQCFFSTLRPDVRDKIEKMVNNNKIVVFMKGNPQEPRCGFSNAVVEILRMHGVTYDAHDVLQDDNLRNDIKTYSSWPTIPQVYINGTFVGGCDILLKLHTSGDLITELEKAGIKSSLNDTKKENGKS
ncbi:hypothetical protein PGB90_005008 [Kerria lacca]